MVLISSKVEELMNAIIVAAGQGKRLRPLTNNIPKCMININNRTILDFQIENLQKYGIKNITVVIGFKKDKVVINKTEANVKFIYNNLFHKTEATYSLFLAKEEMKSDVIILDGDVVFHPNLLELLLNTKHSSVLVDFEKPCTSEDLIVVVKNGIIKDMSKGIKGNGIWVSLIRLEGILLERFKVLLGNKKYWNNWYSKPIKEHLLGYKLTAVSTKGFPWIEIDTIEDLDYARTVIYPGFLRSENV